MFVSMWMTRDSDRRAGRNPGANRDAAWRAGRSAVCRSSATSAGGLKLLGIVTHSDVLHAFPANINPFAVNAADGVAAIEAAAGQSRVTAADLMARDPHITTPDAPIESAARLMRDHKIGALPVVSQHVLVGLITESDIFRAMVEVFEAPDRAVRITFSLAPGRGCVAARRGHRAPPRDARHELHGAAAARTAGVRGAAGGRSGRGDAGRRVEVTPSRHERGESRRRDRQAALSAAA